MPHRDSVPLTWRLQKHKYNIVGKKCHCGALYFPPRALCSACGSTITEDLMLSGDGEIISFTIIHTGPEKFEHHTPYGIALIKLKEGPTISAQVVDDPHKLAIGKKVRQVFRRNSEPCDDAHIKYGFKFELVD